jgi:hypothetical protein
MVFTHKGGGKIRTQKPTHKFHTKKIEKKLKKEKKREAIEA